MTTPHTVALGLVTLLVAGSSVPCAADSGLAQSQETELGEAVPLRAPDEETIPPGPIGAAIRYGKSVLT